MDLDRAKNLISRISKYNGRPVLRIEHLKGDASSRRYSRVIFEDSGTTPLIIMELSGDKGPIVAGEASLTQDQMFVRIEKFLSDNKIPHPRICLDLSDREKILVVEDVGDIALWRLTRDADAKEVSEILGKLGPDPVFRAYQKAIDIMISIQRIPNDGVALPFKRFLGQEQLLTEARRFIEYYCKPKGISSGVIERIDRELTEIANRIAGYPLVLMHRDFMPWNIHVLSNGELAIIDFQDMLLGPPVYDLVGLLTDRDINEDLGTDLEDRLVEYFISVTKLGNCRTMYNTVLLQRSLRLIGQFTLLAEKKNSDFYSKLVPGTIRRAKRVLGQSNEYRYLKETIKDM